MIDEAKQDLATRYVLGELDSRQSSDFCAELADNEELVRFVSDLHESFADIALAAPPQYPPPQVLDRILRHLREDVPAERTVLDSKVIRPNWVPWALAACLAIACTMLALERGRLHREVTVLREQDALSQMRIAMLNSQAEAYAKVLAVVVWDAEKQRGIVKLDQLTQPAADRDYQLWVIDPSRAAPVSAGILPVNDSGLTQAAFRPTQTVRAASKFAVSIERKGGASSPEGPVILISQ
jgi:anti-sigma-K factor RskA